MRNIVITSVFLVAAIVSNSFSETHIPGGNVSGTWDLAGSPYILDGTVTIPANNTLTIDPGVVVKFADAGNPGCGGIVTKYSMIIDGTLLAQG